MHAYVHAGEQLPIRIGDDPAQGDGTGGRIDTHIRKIERAGVAVRRPVLQRQLHHGLIVARECDIARGLLAPQSLHFHRGLIEVDVDGVELLDRGQKSGLALAN